MSLIAGVDGALLRSVVEGGAKPLFATLSGAHLYGFPSPDSDVDLRGVFVVPIERVLGIMRWQETLTVNRLQAGIELDWVAHDVAKFALLMTRRNGYVLEQLYSPHVVTGGQWLEELKALGSGCIVRQLYFHYRGFLQNQRKQLAKGEPTVKALLYAYRVALTGIHVLRTGRIEAHLPTLVESHSEISTEQVGDLIRRKTEGKETGALTAVEAESLTATVDRLEAALDAAYEASDLPVAVEGLKDLSGFVVRARLALGS